MFVLVLKVKLCLAHVIKICRPVDGQMEKIDDAIYLPFAGERFIVFFVIAFFEYFTRRKHKPPAQYIYIPRSNKNKRHFATKQKLQEIAFFIKQK